MQQYGISSYGDITIENIAVMTKCFDIDKFFNNSFCGIALVIITPYQYITIYTNGIDNYINHDQIRDLCLEYLGPEYNNPRIIMELTNIPKLSQYIVQLPCGKNVPITNKMNRLKLYIDSIVRNFQPDGILSECSNDFLFVKKSDAFSYPREKIIGIPIDKQCLFFKRVCSKLHQIRSQHINKHNLDRENY